MHFLNIFNVFILIIVSYFQQIWANPIVNYHQGKNGRAEIVHAVIRPKDLYTGEPTDVNRKLRDSIRAMGKVGDDCGHIAANLLGGPMKPYNLFPHNRNKNRGEFKNTVEAHLQKFLELNKSENVSVDYVLQLVYTSESATRPTMIKFMAKFFKDSKLVPYTQIPRNGKHRVPSNPFRGVILNP